MGGSTTLVYRMSCSLMLSRTPYAEVLAAAHVCVALLKAVKTGSVRPSTRKKAPSGGLIQRLAYAASRTEVRR